MSKLYPFSLKHVSELEIRIACLRDRIQEMREGSAVRDEDYITAAEHEIDLLNEVMQWTVIRDGVAWLPGRLYEVARDATHWVIGKRAHSRTTIDLCGR